jgi:hypothetical protein
MTQKEIAERREAWKKSGDPPCIHPRLELFTTEQGYLTGDYHCLDCGVPVQRTEN